MSENGLPEVSLLQHVSLSVSLSGSHHELRTSSGDHPESNLIRNIRVPTVLVLSFRIFPPACHQRSVSAIALVARFDWYAPIVSAHFDPS
jgi:hypothetical protein